jgi:two-component system, OmpR family, sensor histidine kinase ResE
MAEQTVPNLQPYDYLFRSTSDGIIIADKAGLIKEINPAGAGMLDVAREEAIGKKPKFAFKQNPTLVNLCTREGEQTLDVRLPRRRLAVGIASTLESGERIVVLHDVTERRELDNRREALIKAISHDLKNPISAITGFADLVVRSGDLNEQQTKFMTRIRQTSTKLYDVLGSLVDLAWIEAGMPLEHRPIQLRDVINKAVKQASPFAQDNHIVIAVSVQNPMPMVMGDPMRLQQVIYNLLHNAIVYSAAEKMVAIHGWGDENDVYCSVADQGIGISDDDIDLIFDRMYRSINEAVRNMPGGGLGLTIAKTIVRRFGGDIWASSNLGEGSTFTFLLPTVDDN